MVRSDAIESGQIRFYDNYIPSLGVGNYVINVSQHIHPTDSKTINDTFTASQSFSVQGPRYTIAPENILSMGPANNSEGLFNQFLPQIVLTKPDLPWERNIFQDLDPNSQAPWIALLLFVEGEVIDGKPTLLPPDVDSWQQNRLMTATIPASAFYDHSTTTDILWPNITAEWYESNDELATTQANIIDISPAAFTRFVPCLEDLRYLAHARQIDPSSKSTSYLQAKGDGWYSVVMSKRLPNLPLTDSALPGRLNIVHLVSLEGFEDYIEGKKAIPEDINCVRMISLANWSFTCLEEPAESFADLMNGLLVDENGKQKSTAFHLSLSTGEQESLNDYTLDTLVNGYTPMQYQTQQGEKTFAWFRGPFSPVPIHNFIGDPATDSSTCVQFNSSSAAAIYNTTYGLFDLSYSVAWETGRFMALADPYFGTQLIAWQQSGHSLLDLLLHRQFQLTQLNNKAPDSKSLIASLQSNCLTKKFIKKLREKLASTLAPRLFQGHKHSSKKEPKRPAYSQLQAPIPSKETLDTLLQDIAVKDYVVAEAAEGADYITEWLANLYLLEEVPFENLIPSPDLLPPESVKFFYVDSNWLDCLIEGALSIGLQSSRDQYYQNLTKNQIRSSTYHAVYQARTKIIRKYTRQKPPLTEDSVDKTAMAGMLLRSAAVTDWPGLEVKAYAQTLPDSTPDTSTFIPLLRMDRLSSDILLCLWGQVPAAVTINEPQEGIQFGFEDAPSGVPGSSYFLYLRSLDDANYGMPIDDPQYEIDAMSAGLIDSERQLILEGESGLINTLHNTLPNNPTIAVRDFVTEIIKVPEQAVFATATTTQNAQ